MALRGAPPRAHAVLLAVTDPAAGKPDPRLLRDVLGLTQAEAALAAELAAGATLAAAARARGISLETARTQLKSVLGKTGCARQQDLARLLARLAPEPGG
jgi:DNA-binding CsgD family transcriptional regulator